MNLAGGGHVTQAAFLPRGQPFTLQLEAPVVGGGLRRDWRESSLCTPPPCTMPQAPQHVGAGTCSVLPSLRLKALSRSRHTYEASAPQPMAQAACSAGGDRQEPLPVAENLIMNFLLKLESFSRWNRQYCLNLFVLYLGCQETNKVLTLVSQTA